MPTDAPRRLSPTRIDGVVNWNWATWLVSAFFINYGYFGARTPTAAEFVAHPAAATIQLSLLSLIFVGFARLASKAPDAFRDAIRLEWRDVIVCLSYLLLLLAFSADRLRFSLFSDELFFAQQSVRHGLVFASAATTRFAILDPVPFQYLVQAISAAILITLLGLWLVARRWPPTLRITLSALALVGCRLAIAATGGNASPHPSLNLLPPLVFGALIGINDVAFKLAYFLPYTLFVFVVYRLGLRRCGPATSYLFGLAVGTLPLLWHLGGIVEPSLWGAICLIVVFLDLLTSERPNYIRLMSVISIATLMRQPAIVAVVPVLLVFAIEAIQSKDWPHQVRRTLWMCAPLLICLPFLLASVILGTPSTPAMGQSTGTAARVMTAITSGIVVTSVVNSVSWWWIVLIPFAFVPLARASMSTNFALIGGGAIAVCVYYSISPYLQGSAKYQAEYAVPFAVAGTLCLVARLSASSSMRWMSPVFVAALVGANVDSFARMPESNKPVDVLIDTMFSDMHEMRAGYQGLVAFPFNFSDAYRAIKQANLAEHTYSMGWTYGILPEIMSGYSTQAVRAASDIARKQARLKGSQDGRSPAERVDAIAQDPRIDVVLLGPVGQKPQVIGELLARGWRVAGEYRNEKYGSTVVVARKNGDAHVPGEESRVNRGRD